MKNLFKRAVILVLVVCSVLLASCSGCDNNEDPEEPTSQLVNHQVIQNPTSDFLFSNGKSDYVVVYPQSASDDLIIIIEDFVSLVKEATGHTLQIKNDIDCTYSETDKYISVGKNKVFESAGIETDFNFLGEQGYRIETEGKTIFLYGNTDLSSIYALYKLLFLTLNFEQFNGSTYSLNENVTEIPLMDYDVTEVPDFLHRIGCKTYSQKDKIVAYRMGFNYSDDMGRATVIEAIERDGNGKPTKWGNGDRNHTALAFCNYSRYKDEHPKWFSDGLPSQPSLQQLCYTAHGDETEYQAMIDHEIQVFKDSFIYNQDVKPTDSRLFLYSVADEDAECPCAACDAAREKYNGLAGVAIQHCNAMVKAINAWFETEEGKPYKCDYKIVVLAYYSLEEAPVVYDEDKDEYKPIAPEVVPEKEVGTMYAPIKMNWTKSYSENPTTWEIIRKWSSLVGKDNMTYWSYGTYFYQSLVPFNNYDALQKQFQEAHGQGSHYIMVESAVTNRASGYRYYTEYLNSKLEWNCNDNMQELEDRFFKGMYGAASETMKGLYNSMKLRTNLNLANGYMWGVCDLALYDLGNGYDYWPVSQLSEWIERYEYALEQIAYLERFDEDAYNNYMNNIKDEMISPYYLMIRVHSDDVREDVLMDWKLNFKEIGLAMGNPDVDINTAVTPWDRKTVVSICEGWGI